MTPRTTRRDFLRQGGAATAAWTLCTFDTPAQEEEVLPLPRRAPSERIRIGVIGVGGQGGANLRHFMRDTVAVCDVDRVRLGQARERVGGACVAHNDYRRVLDDRNVDAVVVSTPDHWHALIAIHAAQAGKHVYCEKPLTLAVAEGRAIVRAARRYNVIVQTGSQQRSDTRFRQACELIRNGKLGRLQRIVVGLPRSNFVGPAVADSDPPETLDYETWLGPAPRRPYNVNRVHYKFRFFWDYSGGQMTNFGAHHLDIVQWALGMDESGPTEVTATATFHAQRWYETPETSTLTYTYANGLRLEVGQGNNTPGVVRFEGSDGWLTVDRGRIQANPDTVLRTEFAGTDVRLPVSANHHNNWLDSIRSGRLPICDAEIGHRSATVCHLGNIAIRTGRRVRWDPATETVQDDAEQTRMLTRPYRAPWVLPTFDA